MIRYITEDNSRIVVPSKPQAWKAVRKLSNDTFNKDYDSSDKAGYSVYRSLNNPNNWISDLNDRFELNMDGKSQNIWIDPNSDYTFSEYELEDALSVIDDTIYEIDDKISSDLEECTSIGKARDLLYAAFGEIREILDKDFPNSKLYKKYNL